MAVQNNAVLTHCSLGVGAPNSGALYVGADTTGISVDFPAGTTASFIALSSQDFQGGGSTFVRQLNVEASYPNFSNNGTMNRGALGALVLAESQINFSGPGVVIPIPDLSAGSGGGQTSNWRVTSVSVDGLDWVGGIATLNATVGTEVAVFNREGGGKTINIVSQSLGGVFGMPYPFMTLAYQEGARFRYIAPSFWAMIEHLGGYTGSGSGSSGGGRVLLTTDATPTSLYSFVYNIGPISFTCDIDVSIAGGALYCWRGVRAGWDNSHAVIEPLSWVTEFGNAAGVALGANLSLLDTGGSIHNLMATGRAATNLRWRVNNLRLMQDP